MQLENTQAVLLDNLIAGNVVSGTEAYGGGLEISSTGAGYVTLMHNQFISNTASITQDFKEHPDERDLSQTVKEN